MIFRLFILYLLFNATAYATDVKVGGDAQTDACASLGKIKQKTVLYQSPASDAQRIKNLLPDQQAYICSVSADRKWFGVVLQNAGANCGVSSPKAKRSAYRGPCTSGWVQSKAIEHVAG